MQHVLVIAIAVLCVQALVGVTVMIWRQWNPDPPQSTRDTSERPGLIASAVDAEPTTKPTTTGVGFAVVLVHGFLGFGSIGFGRAKIHYFRRVARRLEARGIDVTVATLPPLGGIPARALALTAQIERLRTRNVIIVAHSLGGLDARWALARGGADHVRALVTIGTPHRGSPIADAFARGPAASLRRALARLGLKSDSVDWLTTERLARFNEEITDVPGVTYASIVAATSDRRRIHPLLRVTHAFLASHGPSDGLVTAASQAWGRVVAEAEIDHWAQVGWSGGHDAAALVERALEALHVLPPGPTPRLLTAPVIATAAT